MRRGRIFILLGILLIVVLAAVALILPRISPGKQPPGTSPENVPTPVPQTRSVVVLAQPVARGDEIDENHVTTIEVPLDLVPDGSFEKPEEVVDRRARLDLGAGQYLTKDLILNPDDILKPQGSDWALVIDPGKVAFSIPISRLAAVSYAPQAGDHVDVIVTLLMVDLDTDFQTLLPNQTAGVVSPGNVEFQAQAGAAGEVDSSTGLIKGETANLAAQVVGGGKSSLLGRTEIDPVLGQPFYVLPSETQRPRIVSQAILQNVTVLGVGTFEREEDAQAQNQAGTPLEPGAEPPQQPAGQAGAEAGQETASQPVTRPPDVITLIVSPQDAITLNFLLYSGAEMTLALRSAQPDSNEVVPTQPVTLQYLMDTYNIPMPAKLPYGVEPRIDELQAPELPNDTPLPTPVQ